MSELSIKNKEKVSLGKTEDLGLYERFEEIIRLIGTQDKNVNKSKSHNKVYRRKLAKEIRDYKTETITNAVLLFGKIN